MPRHTSPARFIAFNLLIGGACLAAIYGLRKFLHSHGLEDYSYPKVSRLAEKDPELIWSVVPPSPVDNLVWIPCYKDLQCARLTVPLDYADPDGPSAIIAMVKVPSKVPKSDKRYRGPILFNPGGPGGSGVALVEKRAEVLRAFLGDDYDFIGFDPRGVGRTIPNVDVFPDDAERTRWRLQTNALPLPNSTLDAVARIHAQSTVYGKLASARTMDASPYVSTALVCRDMLSIVRAHGREKLQYWGFSYGTILGATFAAMFPDHIERMIIDGVADAKDYYAALWSNNLIDTDKGLDWFFEECADAGPELCALHDSSVSKIKERFTALLSALKSDSIAVTAASSLASPADYGIVDYPLALNIVFQFLYGPYLSHARSVSAPSLASALAAAEAGDGAPLWNLQKNDTVEFKCSCSPGPPVPTYANNDATAAISCTDGETVEDSTEDLQMLFDKMTRDSMFGVLWGGRARCAGWKIRSVERFNGHFVGNTSYPILVIGNTVDPVTPVINAHNFAKGFNGSVVLTQHSAGHCSLAASSACTARAVRAYFRDGKLPEPGTVCEIESRMFIGSESVYDSEEWLLDMSEDELKAVKAWKELSDMTEPPKYGMGMM